MRRHAAGQDEFDLVEATIYSWCLEQFMPWRRAAYARGQVFARFAQLNETVPDVFLFAISGGNVQLIEKPQTARHAHYEHSHYRASLYRNFLERVLRALCPELDTMPAMFVGDGALRNADMPVFAFQKPVGNTSPLLPDVNLIDPQFFAAQANIDRVEYGAKTCTAVFAGATTGGIVNFDAIRDLSIPRIRARLFFRDSRDVAFRLPRLVQCASKEVETALREMGFGDGQLVTWAEQFRSRFILSMDGNGPSCERVWTGLRSNSVLMHYASPHVLYYFGGLRPWLHYLPVGRDEDVAWLIGQERAAPGLFERVAQAGREFAETYLNEDAVTRYAAQSLRLYAAAFTDGPVPLDAGTITVLVHVAGVGDVLGHGGAWVEFAGEALAVEGFAVTPADAALRDALVYRTVLVGGAVTGWIPAGRFCGSRGESRALFGFEVAVKAAAAGRFACVYGGRFMDGTQVGPVTEGGVCVSPSGAALRGIWVEMRETV